MLILHVLFEYIIPWWTNICICYYAIHITTRYSNNDRKSYCLEAWPWNKMVVQADWDEFDDPTTVMTSMQVSLKLGQTADGTIALLKGKWHMNVEMRPSKISRFAWGKMPASKFATQKSRRCRGTQFRISWGFATSCSLQNQDFSESQIGELEGAHNGDHFLMIFGSDHALVDTEASKVIWHYALQIEVFRLLWLEFRASLSNRTTHLLLPRQMYLVSSKLATRVKNCEIDDFTILGILRMPVAISTDTNHYKHWLTDHSFRAHGEWAMATITKKSFSSLPEVQNRFKRGVTTMW